MSLTHFVHISCILGHVLSRPGLGLCDRELAAVAALAALNTSERQPELHLNAAPKEAS